MTDRPRPLLSIVVWSWATVLVVSFVVLATLMLPYTLLFDRDRRAAAALVGAMIRWSLMCPVDTREAARQLGRLRPKGPTVFVMNHRSVVDIALAISIGGSPRLAAKPWVARMPLFRYSMWLSGHLVFDPSDIGSVRQTMDELAGLLERGVPVCFFPEGSRRVEPGLGEFARGGFQLAVRTGAVVVPLALVGVGRLMPKGSLLPHHVRVTATVLDPIAAGESAAQLRKATHAALQASLSAQRA